MSVIVDIKREEGFIGDVYTDTQGYPTIGYGTKLPISKEEGVLLLKHRLDKLQEELYKKLPWLVDTVDEAEDIVCNMAYNMGVPRLLKFKKMLAALKDKDYMKASEEMLDSRWNRQVPNRAKRLSDAMKALAN